MPPYESSLAAPTNAIRVWLGFRRADLKRREFVASLKTFLAGTVYMQRPLGLAAYLPAVLPGDKPEQVPDEVALVAYDSKPRYRASMSTLRGKFYAESHGAIFDMARSMAGFPTRLDKKLIIGHSYYMFGNRTNWQDGTNTLTVYHLENSHSKSPLSPFFAKRIASRMLSHRLSGLSEAIIAVGSNYLITWEHWRGKAERIIGLESSKLPTAEESATLTRVFSWKAVPVRYKQASTPFPGLERGCFWNMTF